MNLSQQRREESIRKIREIREFIKHSAQDENAGRLLTYLSELEKDIKGKKYGLVFEEHREKIEWLDKPNLAQYWYGLAAEAGHANSQNYLAALYCPDLEPLNVFKLGRFARRWWEAAAEQKLPNGMRNLARCLKCGKCCCCDRDVPLTEQGTVGKWE